MPNLRSTFQEWQKEFVDNLKLFGAIVYALLQLLIRRSEYASQTRGSFIAEFCQLLLEHDSGLGTCFPKQFTKHILFVKVCFEGTKQRKRKEKNTSVYIVFNIPSPPNTVKSFSESIIFDNLNFPHDSGLGTCFPKQITKHILFSKSALRALNNAEEEKKYISLYCF